MAQKKNEEFPEIRVEQFNEYTPKRDRKTDLIGFATVTIDNVTISGISVMEGDRGIWCSFPARLGKDKEGEDKYFPIVWLNYGSKEENRIAYDAIAAKVQAFLDEED